MIIITKTNMITRKTIMIALKMTKKRNNNTAVTIIKTAIKINNNNNNNNNNNINNNIKCWKILIIKIMLAPAITIR